MMQIEQISEKLLSLIERNVLELEEFDQIYMPDQTRQMQMLSQALKTLKDLSSTDVDREYKEKSIEELNSVFN